MRRIPQPASWYLCAILCVFAGIARAGPGDLDTTFDDDGIVTSANYTLRRVAVQTDGKIVAVGETMASPRDIVVLRYETDGTLDPGFGVGGMTTFDFALHDMAVVDAAIDGSGRIVIASETLASLGFVTRLDTTGNLDGEFGLAGGSQLFGSMTPQCVLVHDDGRILIGAYDVSIEQPVLLALDDAGQYSYTLNGNFYFQYFFLYTGFEAIALQSDGKIVCGFSDSDDYSKWYIERIGANGAPDASFGVGGVVEMAFPWVASFSDLAIDAQDRIVAVGAGNDMGLIRRYTASGGGTDNNLEHSSSDGEVAFTDIVHQTDGKVVVVGTLWRPGTSDNEIYVARCDTSIALDADFGIDGIVTVDAGGEDAGTGLALQSDGKIVLCGTEVEGSTSYGVVARLLAEDDAQLLALRNVHKKNRSDQLCLVTDVETGALSTVGNLGSDHTATKAMAVVPGESGDDDRIFAAERGQLLEIDAASGEATVVGAIGWSDVTGLAVHPDTGVLYGITYGTNRLLTIDTDTGAGTVVASRVLNSSRLNDLAFHPDGDLYVVTNDSRPRLFRVHATTGRKLERWDLTGGTGLESLLWSEDGETLYSAATRNGYKDLCTIDLDNSTITFVSATSSSMRDIEGLGWFRGDVGVTKAMPEGGDDEDVEDPDEFPDSVLPEVAAPTRLQLHECVPNPFNPTTRIDFELPESGEVHLLVHDVAGRLVAVLARGRFAAGRHTTTWNGRTTTGERAASGTYFATLRTAGTTQTRTLVLLK